MTIANLHKITQNATHANESQHLTKKMESEGSQQSSQDQIRTTGLSPAVPKLSFTFKTLVICSTH